MRARSAALVWTLTPSHVPAAPIKPPIEVSASDSHTAMAQQNTPFHSGRQLRASTSRTVPIAIASYCGEVQQPLHPLPLERDPPTPTGHMRRHGALLPTQMAARDPELLEPILCQHSLRCQIGRRCSGFDPVQTEVLVSDAEQGADRGCGDPPTVLGGINPVTQRGTVQRRGSYRIEGGVAQDRIVAHHHAAHQRAVFLLLHDRSESVASPFESPKRIGPTRLERK